MSPVLAAAALAATAFADARLAALAPELARNLAGLALPDQPVPYYLAFSEVEIRQLETAARLGGVVQDEESRQRSAQVRIRVGATDFDQTNFMGGGWGGGGAVRSTSLDAAAAPALRDFWLAADGAYKRAVETCAAKRAALKREARPKRAPDFLPAAPGTHWEPLPEFAPGERERLRALAVALSAPHREFPGVQRAEVRIAERANAVRFADSDGFAHLIVERAVRVLVTAETQAADGTPLRDVMTAMAPSVDLLPPPAELAALALGTVRRLADRASAEDLPDPYLGPVLFTARAAAEFVRQTLATDLCGTPSPLAAEDYMKGWVKGGQLARFRGLRILPTWMDVTDDPALTSWRGRPLVGAITVDREGVRAERVALVREGRLKDFLRSRTPAEDRAPSNGHGRIVSGDMVRAGPANLVCEARGGLSEGALMKKLLALAAQEGLPYALVVRHLDEPPTGEGGPRRINVGTGAEDAEESPSRWAISPAFDVARVDLASGRETRLRGAIFGPVGVAELRSLVAAGDEPHVYNFILNPESQDYAQGYADDAVASVVAPALLFAQLEVRATAKKRKPLPLLRSPLAPIAP